MQEHEDGKDAGYLKKDKKKSGDGYKNFKSFANKNKDDFEFQKHEGFSTSDSQSKLGDTLSKPKKEYHHYEVTEKSDNYSPKNAKQKSTFLNHDGRTHSNFVKKPTFYGFESFVYHDDGPKKETGSSSEHLTDSSHSGESEQNEDKNHMDDGFENKKHTGYYQEYSQEDDDENSNNDDDSKSSYEGSSPSKESYSSYEDKSNSDESK